MNLPQSGFDLWTHENLQTHSQAMSVRESMYLIILWVLSTLTILGCRCTIFLLAFWNKQHLNRSLWEKAQRHVDNFCLKFPRIKIPIQERLVKLEEVSINLDQIIIYPCTEKIEWETKVRKKKNADFKKNVKLNGKSQWVSHHSTIINANLLDNSQ